ncbi:hypothetical protein CSIRO_3506 [Bradyrhizobiaceae bacterium SG-6C]|nr:hypothetical protein CSIRO_3506 [Bradyrhizobiaceae bacterium SG-6C]
MTSGANLFGMKSGRFWPRCGGFMPVPKTLAPHLTAAENGLRRGFICR